MLDPRFASADNGRRNRAANPPPKAWGVGRVAFFARIDKIRAELAQGWPLTAVYARHKEALGIGYWGFCRLVVRHAADARPVPIKAVKAPVPSVEGPDAHAGQQPPRTFNHDPIERPGDYERLFGARKR